MNNSLATSHETAAYHISDTVTLWVSTWTRIVDGVEQFHVSGTFQRMNADRQWKWDNETSVSFHVTEAWRLDYLHTDLAYDMWKTEVGVMNVPVRFVKTHSLDTAKLWSERG